MQTFFAPSRSRAHLAIITLGMAAVATTNCQTAHAVFTSFTASGSTLASSIQPTVDAFRTAIGGVNNGNTLMAVGSGRREINWDGGGGAIPGVTTASPLTTFTNTRGATMTTSGTALLQTPVNDALLTGLNAQYANIFTPFSTFRIFTPVGSNVTDVTFTVPGSGGAVPTTVSAFGAVFSDVDLPNTTKIEFFNLASAMINLLNVPQGGATTAQGGSLSFAGAVATAGEQIARVRITTGNIALGAGVNDNNGDNNDLVVMDDFIYAEPAIVPEPAAATLAAVALLGAAATRRRRLQ